MEDNKSDMTMRDYYAVYALVGVVSSLSGIGLDKINSAQDRIVELTFSLADKCLAERGKYNETSSN